MLANNPCLPSVQFANVDLGRNRSQEADVWIRCPCRYCDCWEHRVLRTSNETRAQPGNTRVRWAAANEFQPSPFAFSNGGARSVSQLFSLESTLLTWHKV